MDAPPTRPTTYHMELKPLRHTTREVALHLFDVERDGAGRLHRRGLCDRVVTLEMLERFERVLRRGLEAEGGTLTVEVQEPRARAPLPESRREHQRGRLASRHPPR